MTSNMKSCVSPGQCVQGALRAQARCAAQAVSSQKLCSWAWSSGRAGGHWPMCVQQEEPSGCG